MYKVFNTKNDYEKFYKKTKDVKTYDEFLPAWIEFENIYQDYFDEVVFCKKENKNWEETREVLLNRYYQNFQMIHPYVIQEYESFNETLEFQMALFKKFFPDSCFRDLDIYIIPSLLTYNGKSSFVKDRNSLLFGVDFISLFRMNPNLIPGIRYSHNSNVFYSHEIFHIYHLSKLKNIKNFENRTICSETINNEMIEKNGLIAHSLWFEGLAQYVSKVMNPTVSVEDIFMDDHLHSLCKNKRKLLMTQIVQDYNLNINTKEGREIYKKWFLVSSKDEVIPKRAVWPTIDFLI